MLLNRPWMLPGPLSRLFKTYLTASDLGMAVPLEARRRLWSAVPRDQALTLLALALADVDAAGTYVPSSGNLSVRWANSLRDPILRQRVGVAAALGNELLAPQLLILAIREALQACPARDRTDKSDVTNGTDGMDGIDEVTLCLLGIADELSTADLDHGDLAQWAGLDPTVASDLIANQHFSRTTPFGYLVSTAADTWQRPWPDTVPHAALDELGGQPAELFVEATGIHPHVLIDLGVFLMTQFAQHRSLIFPPEFFDEIGFDPGTRDAALALVSTDTSTLTSELTAGSDKWAFTPLRRWPLLRLGDGRILILRLAWLLERTLSDVTYVDILDHLETYDQAHGSRRRAAFKTCAQAKFEADVGDSLRRSFRKRGGTVWHESELQQRLAPVISSSQPPKVCDYAVQVGKVWLVIDVTDRAMPVDVVKGIARTNGVRREIERVLTERKAQQLQSTITLIRDHATLLTGRPIDPDAVFVPLVVPALGGLMWGIPIADQAATLLQRRHLLQESNVLPAALLSMKDLSLIESESQSLGVRAIDLLVDWRAGNLSGWSFEHYLFLTGRKVKAPRRESQAVELLTRAVVARAKRAVARAALPFQEERAGPCDRRSPSAAADPRTSVDGLSTAWWPGSV